MKRTEFLAPMNRLREIWSYFCDLCKNPYTEIDEFLRVEIEFKESMGTLYTWNKDSYWRYSNRKNPNRLTLSQSQDLWEFLGDTRAGTATFYPKEKLREIQKEIRKRANNG